MEVPMHSTAQLNQTMPRILLNFDLNGTLILKDTSKKVDDQYMIISALAETTFASWNGKQSTSFKQYVYTELLPGDKSNPHLKLERQKTIGKFVEWLKKNQHPALESVEKTYRTIIDKFTDSKTGEINFMIFPSFYVMINQLRLNKIPFTIILRTFGSDLPEVMEEIEKHPDGVKFSYQVKFDGPRLIVNGMRPVEKADEIFDLILNSEKHFAIQDDWKYWNQHKEQALYGKPFLYDLSGTRAKNLSLFFDDNITGDEHLDIIHPCEISGHNIVTQALCDWLIFPVNTMEAMLECIEYIFQSFSPIHSQRDVLF